MRQNWFTTLVIAVLAGTIGAVGFGVAGAQTDTDGEATDDGVTINVDQPGSAAGGAVGGGNAPDVAAVTCPGGAAGAGQGGGGAVAAGANTNTLVNGVVVENENVNVNEPEQEQTVVSLPLDELPLP